MTTRLLPVFSFAFALFAALLPAASDAATPNIGPQSEELLLLENGTVKIGIDRAWRSA